MNSRLSAYLALLLTVAIWGVAGPVIKVTLRDIQPFTFLALRFFINTIVISPILLFYLRSHPIKVADLPRLSLLTLLGTTATLSLIFLGLDRTTALDATLIIATAPLFIVIGGSLICIKGVICLHERVTQLEKIGLAIALIGVGVAVIQPLLEQGVFAWENLTGNLLVLASNFTWTAFTLLAKEDFKRFTFRAKREEEAVPSLPGEGFTPFIVTAFSFIFGLFTFLPLALLENLIPSPITYYLSPNAVLGVLYMSLLSSIVAYFTYAWGISKIEASEAALFFYLEPIFAAPFAYLWLGERITPTFLLGAAIIATGVILTEIAPLKHQ